MARKRKSKGEANGAGDTTSPPTTDNLDEQQLQAKFYARKRRMKALIAAATAAKKAVTEEEKRALKELGPTAVKDIKDSLAIDGKGGIVAYRAEIERQLRVARWAGIGLGHQLDIFKDSTPQPTPAELGRIAGLNGDAMTPPYDVGSAAGQDWLNAYHDGSKEIAAIQRGEDTALFDGDDADAGDEEDAGVGSQLTDGEQEAARAIAEKGVIGAIGEALGDQPATHRTI